MNKKIDNIVQQIKKQQIECANHVYIEPLTEAEIKKLLIEGNYFYTERDGKILVSFYVKPLLEACKLYRLGGFVISNIGNPSFVIKREVVKSFVKLQQYIFRCNLAFIAQTDTVSSESFYINMGAKKFSFKECLAQYPLFLKAFLDTAIGDKECFKSKIFYVREVRAIAIAPIKKAKR